MKATVKIYKNDGSKSGMYPVKLIVTHQKKIKRKTIAHAFESDWDSVKQLPRPSHPDYELLYGQVMEYRAKAVRQAFRQLEDVDAGMDFFADAPVKKNVNFYDFAREEIARMRGMGRKGNAFAYEFSVAQLEKFAPNLEFDDIDRYLLETFKREKMRAGLKNTSIRTYLYEIRALYNTAVRLGLCADNRPFTGLFLDLPVRKRRAKNIYLDANGIKKLKSLGGLTVPQQLAVDLSLLQFYLGGLDLVDVYHIKMDQLSGGRLYLQRTKLGVKGYGFDVLIPEPARAIMEKYHKESDGYYFPWRKGEVAYKTFRSTHNATLKRVQKNHGIELMPNGGKLTSKVMRHTFATLAKFQAIDVDIIREIMGHERNEIDTVYKDKYPEKVRDAAQLKIISI